MSGSPFKKISKKHCAISMMQFRNKKIYEQEAKTPYGYTTENPNTKMGRERFFAHFNFV